MNDLVILDHAERFFRYAQNAFSPRKYMSDLSHFDTDGNSQMVDVGSKPVSRRLAEASAVVVMKPETLTQITSGQVNKGDVFEVARIAGIMATKRTADLIPLCHPLAIDSVTVSFEIMDEGRLRVSSNVLSTGKTGVEMEALTSVSIAALTVYDMCKSVDREIVVTAVQLEQKSGGKSGLFVRSSSGDP